MIPVSAAFQAAMRKSHTITTKCEVYQNGVWQTDLPVHDGNVTVDFGVDIRRRFDLRLTSSGPLVPGVAGDLLTPYGNEIKMYKGVKFPDGTTETVPLGVFGIADVNIYDSGDGFMIAVSGYDRSRKISRAKLLQDYAVPVAVNYATAIRDLIFLRSPSTVFNPSDSSAWAALTTQLTPDPPLSFVTGDDPWAKAQSMAGSIGMDLYFDVYGVCNLSTPKDPQSPVVSIDWEFRSGSTAEFLNLQRRFTDENAVNHVVVTGERADGAGPIRAEAYDNNTSSPTYIGGAFGDVVYYTQSSGVNNITQAQNLADATLKSLLGAEETLTFTCIANPSFDVGDIIYVNRGLSKVDSKYQVDKITHPFIEERAMNISCRRRRI